MNSKLLELLGCQEKITLWRQTPIQEWAGFTVADMERMGFWKQVQAWFGKLTDEEVLAISREKPLYMSSSPIEK